LNALPNVFNLNIFHTGFVFTGSFKAGSAIHPGGDDKVSRAKGAGSPESGGSENRHNRSI
jgi:hypothetical protein